MAVKFRSLSVVVNASIPTELQTEKVLPANISLAVVDDDLGGAVDDNNVTVCVLSGTLVRGRGRERVLVASGVRLFEGVSPTLCVVNPVHCSRCGPLQIGGDGSALQVVNGINRTTSGRVSFTALSINGRVPQT
jgi:hypothetical protein